LENTICENCPYVKMGLCTDIKDCPNYVESWWTEQGGCTPKLVKDCSPKRLMIQQQYLQLRLEMLQASSDSCRNEYIDVACQFKEMLALTEKLLIKHPEQSKLLEGKNEVLTLDDNASST
jgi:hypothetical protein